MRKLPSVNEDSQIIHGLKNMHKFKLSQVCSLCLNQFQNLYKYVKVQGSKSPSDKTIN